MTERTTTCRGCGAPVIWKYTESGKRMPLDAEPSETRPGSYRIEGDRCIAAQPLLDPPGTVTRMNHWATCKTPEAFRSKKP